MYLVIHGDVFLFVCHLPKHFNEQKTKDESFIVIVIVDVVIIIIIIIILRPLTQSCRLKIKQLRLDMALTQI